MKEQRKLEPRNDARYNESQAGRMQMSHKVINSRGQYAVARKYRVMTSECICEQHSAEHPWLHEFMCPLYVSEPVARDAARYRWLRDHSLLSEWAHNRPGATDAAAIDAAIDEEMKA